MRIYYEERFASTVPEEVRPYCKMSSDGSRFVLPSAEQVQESRIVVTTLSMSAHLVRLGLRGKFSHIFLDEAGQALECEAITPFALAAPTTCVILAGDHKQMCPAVYCPRAREKKFHVSLLERLFVNYRKLDLHLLSSNTIMLHRNYRTCDAILDFLSGAFYQQKQCLVASRTHKPSVTSEDHKTLSFYCTEGDEEVDGYSYFNVAEIEEVTHTVVKFQAIVPQQQDICVVSYYSSQVCPRLSSLAQINYSSRC